MDAEEWQLMLYSKSCTLADAIRFYPGDQYCQTLSNIINCFEYHLQPEDLLAIAACPSRNLMYFLNNRLCDRLSHHLDESQAEKVLESMVYKIEVANISPMISFFIRKFPRLVNTILHPARYGPGKHYYLIHWMEQHDYDLFCYLVNHEKILLDITIVEHISNPCHLKMCIMTGKCHPPPFHPSIFHVVRRFDLDMIKQWLRQGVHFDDNEVHKPLCKTFVQRYRAMMPLVVQYSKHQGWTKHSLFDKNILLCIKQWL
jgi:hypothetical protein